MPDTIIVKTENLTAFQTRPPAPQSGIDRDALSQTLDRIAQDGLTSRTEILSAIKSAMDAAKLDTRTHFETGRLSGLECARRIAAIHDDVLLVLFTFATTHISKAPNPTKSEIMALCAVGGFGRGEMAPHSDVDLLFLIADKKGSAFTENVTEYILYILWDLGLKVGHATRTIEQCILLAKEDQTILTALLDMRYLCGDTDLVRKLEAKFKRDVTRGKGRPYIATKLTERDARHEREGDSRYVIEPNIKEGKGGLRDLHVLYWIARFLDNGKDIIDPQRASEYVEWGLFNTSAATRFTRAADFLWRARIHLHYNAGRPTETLSFDHQTVLARKMGHASGPIEVAVEKFMREYFTNAREVGALTRIACAKLEADNRLRLPTGLVRLLPTTSRRFKEPGFRLENGRLTFDDPMQIRENPALIMRLFDVAGRRNLDIHPDAQSAIDFRRNLIDNNFRRDPEIAEIFKNILLESRGPYAILKLMTEFDVLGRYLLEYGGIVARTQFNMHHAYTVDEHTLRLVDWFNNIEYGLLKDENPIATDIVAGFDDSQRHSLYMTCLLHDTGKGVGDQCIEGARLARRACRRLGMSQAEIERVSWLVRSHLDMSETAQRRDISDPQTIAEFASRVGSVRRLQMLYILTIVDIRSVGPGIWNDWKGSLLRDLYRSTETYLQGRAELEPAAKSEAMRAQFKDRLPGDVGKRIRPITQELGESYWTGFNMTELVRHARFFDSAISAGVETSVHTHRDRNQDITQLWVLTRDRPGLFADLTLAISSCGASITGARLHTGENGRVMNVFYLQNPDGLAFGRKNDDALKRLKLRAEKAARGDIENLNIPATLASKRAGAIPVRPVVKFIEGASGDVTIIEIEGRDRPGLLYAVASELHAAALEVRSAHIENVGERAIDAFYVICRNGTTNLQPKRRKALKSALISVMDVPSQSSSVKRGP